MSVSPQLSRHPESQTSGDAATRFPRGQTKTADSRCFRPTISPSQQRTKASTPHRNIEIRVANAALPDFPHTQLPQRQRHCALHHRFIQRVTFIRFP
jgi:hypothetical protein